MKNKNLLTGLLMLFSVSLSLPGWSQCAVVVEASETAICPEESVMLYAETLPSVLSTYAAGNGQNGNMFDITALNNITITSFDGHLMGISTTMEIYYKTGTHVGSEGVPGDWIFLGSAYVVSIGTGLPSPIPIPVNVTIPAGETYAFYITTSVPGTYVNYTNGTLVGNVYAANSDLEIHEGKGIEYPFGYTYQPRVWNGDVHYTLSPTTYLWNTGETTPIITVNPTVTTLYSVDVDMAGCLTSGSVEITVDNSAPVPNVATLPDINSECLTLTPPTATDNCEGVIVATTADPLTYTVPGSYVVNWEYDDGYGNTTTQTQNVTILADGTAPVPDLATLPDIVGQCTVTVSAPTAWDNCDGVVVGTTTDPTTYTVIGTYVITWTYEDATGNIATQTQNVEVNSGPDVTAPIPDEVSLPDVLGECTVTVTDVPTATDGCAGTIVGTTTDPLTYSAQGTYTITWSYNDGLDNISTQTQTVIIDDITAPVPDVATLPALYAQCSLTVTDYPTATDNCEGIIIGTTTDPLSYAVQGVYSITWTFDDGNGNTSTQVQSVTISDVYDPIPDVADLPDLTGECSVNVTDIPIAWDNCVGVVNGTMSNPWSYSTQGTYTITWTYNDGHGNSTTQLQQVIVDDITPPVPDVATLPDITAECSATVTAPTATDNCEGAITATTADPLTYDAEGSYVVTWVYDDGNGNTTEQTQNVIIDDITDPVPDLATLPDIVNACSYTVITVPTATDNCAGSITATTSDPLDYDVAGVYTITWVYDDGNGNSVEQLQSITIEDIEAPVPDLASLPDIAADCSVSLTAPTATDVCQGVITGTTDTLYLDMEGSYTITWTYDDGSGNTATQTQLVVIEDSIAPTATCPEDVQICNGEIGSIALADVDDNCTTPSISYVLTGATTASGTGDASSETFAAGETTVTYTLDDGNGNTMECSFVVSNVVTEVATVTEADGVLSVAIDGTYQWINCDGNTPIDGATASSYEPEASGDYAVIVTQGSCPVTSNCYTVDIVNGLKKNNLSEGFEVYPNPVEDRLIIELGSMNTNLTLVMINIGGQVVYNQEFESAERIVLDVNDFKDGIYLIHLTSDQQNGYVRVVKD